MPDIFDEVEEDLRAERAKNLFRRYGWLMIGVLVLFLLGVGGWQAWRWQAQQQAMAAAGVMLTAMRAADALPPPPAAAPAGAREAAIAQFAKLAETAPETYRTLALLREAALKADMNDLAGAEALWNRLAGDGSADPLLRDLATLLSVERQPADAPAGPLLARLKPLTSPDNAWHALALEQQSLIQMRSGATDAARDTLRQLAADVTVPDGVRNRANGLLAKLGG